MQSSKQPLHFLQEERENEKDDDAISCIYVQCACGYNIPPFFGFSRIAFFKVSCVSSEMSGGKVQENACNQVGFSWMCHVTGLLSSLFHSPPS